MFAYLFMLLMGINYEYYLNSIKNFFDIIVSRIKIMDPKIKLKINKYHLSFLKVNLIQH